LVSREGCCVMGAMYQMTRVARILGS